MQHVRLPPHPSYPEMQLDYFFKNRQDAEQSFRNTFGGVMAERLVFTQASTPYQQIFKVTLNGEVVGTITEIDLLTQPTHF